MEETVVLKLHTYLNMQEQVKKLEENVKNLEEVLGYKFEDVIELKKRIETMKPLAKRYIKDNSYHAYIDIWNKSEEEVASWGLTDYIHAVMAEMEAERLSNIESEKEGNE